LVNDEKDKSTKETIKQKGITINMRRDRKVEVGEERKNERR
jgi:hypothetical protein